MIGAVGILAAAGGDGARGAELIGEIVKEAHVGSWAARGVDAGGDAATSEKHVFGVARVGHVPSAVGFGERMAGKGTPIKFGVRSAAAIGTGAARDFSDAEAVAVVDVAWMFLARFRGQGDAWVAPAYSCPRKASTMQMSAIQIP